jgi:hypothetical protein
MDKFYGHIATLIVGLVLSLCGGCNFIVLIAGIIGLVATREPTARRNALILTVVAGALLLLYVIGYSTGVITFPKLQGG